MSKWQKKTEEKKEEVEPQGQQQDLDIIEFPTKLDLVERNLGGTRV